VTGAFVSMRDRLQTARAERKGLLRRLELAPTETAASAIRRRLAIVGRRIAALRERIRRARERTEFATVLVELIDEATDAASRGETGEAVDDAVGTLEDVLNFLIRALGVLLPVAIVALLVWLAASRARRRARDRALA
jgi:membrane protein required for beta-lactamase induction